MSKQEARREALVLESLEVGAHPLIEPLLERLGLREFLQHAFARPDPRLKLAPVDSALVLIRNFTLCRHPLYEVPQWVRRMVPSELELSPEQVDLINDDRLGRALDKLFLADRRSVVTRLIVHMAQEFRLDLQRLHNDSTTITFSGVYNEHRPREDGRRRLRITHGHNKDHRPDFKQLVWSVTVTCDGAVPVHYNVFDGNVTDDQTHIEIWKTLRGVVGSPNFVYVADAKLCTRENMGFIHGQDGRFITVLPRTRKEMPGSSAASRIRRPIGSSSGSGQHCGARTTRRSASRRWKTPSPALRATASYGTAAPRSGSATNAPGTMRFTMHAGNCTDSVNAWDGASSRRASKSNGPLTKS